MRSYTSAQFLTPSWSAQQQRSEPVRRTGLGAAGEQNGAVCAAHGPPGPRLDRRHLPPSVKQQTLPSQAGDVTAWPKAGSGRGEGPGAEAKGRRGEGDREGGWAGGRGAQRKRGQAAIGEDGAAPPLVPCYCHCYLGLFRELSKTQSGFVGLALRTYATNCSGNSLEISQGAELSRN